MGSVSYAPGEFNDYLAELTGYKVGLALTLEELYDHLAGEKGYADLSRQSETNGIRLHSIELEAVNYRLMYRVGFTETEYDGDHTGVWMLHKYRAAGQLDVYEAVSTLWLAMMKNYQFGGGQYDPEGLVNKSYKQYGPLGAQIALEKLQVLEMAVRMSTFINIDQVIWDDRLSLDQLFRGAKVASKPGAFIDQRFIDYLSANNERIGEIHWRKFEELTAEFFGREGFKVELGPGSNDDGVDVRVWDPSLPEGTSPLCLIQCKRHKDKIDKGIIKVLNSDVEWQRAEYGVIVTTSSLSPGAKKTIEARGYPIEAVEREAVLKWLSRLRTPGTGIVRF